VARLAALKQDYVDYHIIVEPRPAGPVIGYFAGQPIAASVVDYFGRRFLYEGVAPRRRNGQYDIQSLRPGEWIVEPGLLYQFDMNQPRSGADKAARRE
jgi:hypothetical protein